MERPEFPVDFFPHCHKVQEAIEWHQKLGKSLKDFNPKDWCECEFTPAGAGMECQCGLFLTRPFLHHKLDEEFLPQIEEYYRQLKIWEEHQQQDVESYIGANI